MCGEEIICDRGQLDNSDWRGGLRSEIPPRNLEEEERSSANMTNTKLWFLQAMLDKS